MTVALAPMTVEQFARLRVPLERSYAESMAAANGLAPEAARADAALRVARLLPRGIETEGVLLRTGLVDGVEVGWIWVTMPGPDRPGTAWIHNVEVHPGHRGRGHGRRMIQLVEGELARFEVDRLGLNVFGPNTAAIGLYESLGFRVTTQQMAKRVAASG